MYLVHIPWLYILILADEELKKALEERQQAAEERQLQLTKTSSMFDDEDDHVLEKIFNSLTGNV